MNNEPASPWRKITQKSVHRVPPPLFSNAKVNRTGRSRERSSSTNRPWISDPSKKPRRRRPSPRSEGTVREWWRAYGGVLEQRSGRLQKVVEQILEGFRRLQSKFWKVLEGSRARSGRFWSKIQKVLQQVLEGSGASSGRFKKVLEQVLEGSRFSSRKFQSKFWKVLEQLLEGSGESSGNLQSKF